MSIFAKVKAKNNRDNESGETNAFLIATIFLGIAAVALGIAFGWAFMQMGDYRDNSDQKVNVAVEEARATQKTESAQICAEEAKLPHLVFTGPADFGSVTFEYPKTWAVFVEKDGTGATSSTQYTAFFNPKIVPPINAKTPVALRMNIESRAYDQVLRSYDSKIKRGELKASPITLGQTADFRGYEGTRIDGQFDDGITGSAVIFKIRDKTLTLRVDSQNYMGDFNETILTTLKFEQ
jgi:hypothetical protein